MRKKARQPIPVIPRHLTWLLRTLEKGYGRITALEIIGDVARWIIKRRKKDCGRTHTSCIACGGWIPADRERRKQHTCSESCHDWYRRFSRALDASRKCRYCGHGLKGQKSPRMRRPKAKVVQRQIASQDANKTLGAVRHNMLKVPPRDSSVVLRPDSPKGVTLGALEDAVEDINATEF